MIKRIKGKAPHIKASSTFICLSSVHYGSGYHFQRLGNPATVIQDSTYSAYTLISLAWPRITAGSTQCLLSGMNGESL